MNKQQIRIRIFSIGYYPDPYRPYFGFRCPPWPLECKYF